MASHRAVKCVTVSQKKMSRTVRVTQVEAVAVLATVRTLYLVVNNSARM